MGRQKQPIPVGERINRLTITRETEPRIYKYENYTATLRRVEAKCDCGNVVEVNYNQLKNETVKSCGCLKSQLLKQKHDEYRKRKNQG